VLVELGLVEQRYEAVLDVLHDGATVTDVARRNGLSRQTVREWLRKYAAYGLAGLSAPAPEQHPPQARKRKRADYKRWERSRAMELWQMDIVGGVRLTDGSEAKIVSGVDDHSRFCVSAYVVARATARPTCDGLASAMRTHGVPSQILTDNGKVFTGRFGSGAGEVLFDRICRENGIKHLLTAPRSPTTTGKVERWHKTPRREFLNGKVFATIDDAQAQLDGWVREYNFERPHQSLGMAVPWDRFQLAQPGRVELDKPVTVAVDEQMPTTTRRVGRNGLISFAGVAYRAGVWLAGEDVTV